MTVFGRVALFYLKSFLHWSVHIKQQSWSAVYKRNIEKLILVLRKGSSSLSSRMDTSNAALRTGRMCAHKHAHMQTHTHAHSSSKKKYYSKCHFTFHQLKCSKSSFLFFLHHKECKWLTTTHSICAHSMKTYLQS